MDLYFLFFASFGIIVFGLSKGGFPGPISMLAVPIMSFAMSPLKAAGILLPLLLVMAEGSVLFKGTPNEVMKNEKVIESYLGRAMTK